MNDRFCHQKTSTPKISTLYPILQWVNSHFTNMSADGVTMTKKDMLPEKINMEFCTTFNCNDIYDFARQYEQMTNVKNYSLFFLKRFF